MNLIPESPRSLNRRQGCIRKRYQENVILRLCFKLVSGTFKVILDPPVPLLREEGMMNRSILRRRFHYDIELARETDTWNGDAYLVVPPSRARYTS